MTSDCVSKNMNCLSSSTKSRVSTKTPLAVLCVASILGAGSSAFSQSVSSVDAAALIEQIKTEIQEARKVKMRPTLTIKNVKVTVKAIAERSVDGGIKFVIPIVPVSINTTADVNNTITQTLSFSFKPEGSADIAAKSSLGLAAAINAAKVVVQSALTSEPRFKLDDLVYEADFVLKADGKGGFSFWVFHAGAEISMSSMQHIEIELSPAEAE